MSFVCCMNSGHCIASARHCDFQQYDQSVLLDVPDPEPQSLSTPVGRHDSCRDLEPF